MKKIAVIGYRGHAKRIIERVKKHSDVKLTAVKHPYIVSPAGSEFYDIEHVLTDDWFDVVKCDAAIIAVPTHVHGDVMRKLRDELSYKGHIMCEKPPYTSIDDIEHFRSYDDRTCFNFNFEHGKISSLFDAAPHHMLGEPIHVDIHMTHGFAHTKRYANSWRSQKVYHPFGVAETVGSHWIDMLMLKFGDTTCKFATATSRINGCDAYDTATMLFDCAGVPAHVFVSYAGEARFMLSLQYTHGSIVWDAGELVMTRDNEVLSREPLTLEPIYEESLDISIKKFLDCVIDNASTDSRGYTRAINTCRILHTIGETFL